MSLRWSRFKGRVSASATWFVALRHGGCVERHMVPLYRPKLNSGLTLRILEITTLHGWPWPCLAGQRRGRMSCSLVLVTAAQSCCWSSGRPMAGLEICCVTLPGWKQGLHFNMSFTCLSHRGLTGTTMSSNILMPSAISASASSVSNIPYMYIYITNSNYFLTTIFNNTLLNAHTHGGWRLHNMKDIIL